MTHSGHALRVSRFLWEDFVASELEDYFNSAEECAKYETFCAEQERGLEKFELADPALVCRWRMSKRQVPLLNRHIRALSHRVVNGAPLTHNMLSWAKQHVEWSLFEGSYEDPNGVLMLVIDVNGDALMSVGPYEPLPDCSLAALVARAEVSRTEAAMTGVAPELLAWTTSDGRICLCATPDEPLCGAATLVEQLAQTEGCAVERTLTDDVPLSCALDMAGDGAAPFLISDEHGVALASEISLAQSEAADVARGLSEGVAKLFS